MRFKITKPAINKLDTDPKIDKNLCKIEQIMTHRRRQYRLDNLERYQPQNNKLNLPLKACQSSSAEHNSFTNTIELGNNLQIIIHPDTMEISKSLITIMITCEIAVSNQVFETGELFHYWNIRTPVRALYHRQAEMRL